MKLQGRRQFAEENMVLNILANPDVGVKLEVVFRCVFAGRRTTSCVGGSFELLVYVDVTLGVQKHRVYTVFLKHARREPEITHL